MHAPSIKGLILFQYECHQLHLAECYFVYGLMSILCTARDRKLLSEKTHAFCWYYCFWGHQQMMSKPEISRYFFYSAFEWISWLSNSFQTRNISSCYFLYIWILAYAVWERQDWIYWYGVGASTHRSLMLQICCFVRFLAGQCIK